MRSPGGRTDDGSNDHITAIDDRDQDDQADQHARADGEGGAVGQTVGEGCRCAVGARRRWRRRGTRVRTRAGGGGVRRAAQAAGGVAGGPGGDGAVCGAQRHTEDVGAGSAAAEGRGEAARRGPRPWSGGGWGPGSSMCSSGSVRSPLRVGGMISALRDPVQRVRSSRSRSRTAAGLPSRCTAWRRGRTRRWPRWDRAPRATSGGEVGGGAGDHTVGVVALDVALGARDAEVADLDRAHARCRGRRRGCCPA